jgi:hypothetical protein
MFHACVQRFDMTGNLKILAKFLASKRCLKSKKNACFMFVIKYDFHADGSGKRGTEATLVLVFGFVGVWKPRHIVFCLDWSGGGAMDRGHPVHGLVQTAPTCETGPYKTDL